MKILEAKMKYIKRRGELLLMVVVISLMALTATQALALEAVPILELTIPNTARVVDSDDGIYVVGTSGGSLYVINEAGNYTVTTLEAGRINDVRIENGFIAVAAGTTVIELSLSGLTPVELWRTTLSGWREVVSTDLSEDGSSVCYLAQRNASYTDAGEVGVLSGTDGSLISRKYASGWVYCNWWIDATGDMEYITASQPMHGCCYKVGVALYQFDGSTLTMNWWKHLIPKYETTEVRISEAKDYIAVATSSGTFMKLLSISDGTILGSYETPGKEQYACDGDDYLNIVIGANQAWSPPYGWFILWNLGTSGYAVLDEGTMSGPISDLDSNSDASLLAFGSGAGEFILLRRSDGTIETVFDEDLDEFIDTIEIGDITLLVGGQGFINLYGWNRPPVADAGPDQIVEQESYDGTEITLDGSGSTDPDSSPGTNDDILFFDWHEGSTLLGSGETLDYTFPLGVHTVTLEVTDFFGETDDDEVVITVVDNTPPEVACYVNPEVLWSPNHKMVPVIVLIEALDICTETEDLDLLVTAESSEPDDDKGDGAFTGDVDGFDGFTAPVDVFCEFDEEAVCFVSSFALRAERDGRGVDRIYTITATITDLSGNVASCSCTVVVPHDQGKGKK